MSYRLYCRCTTYHNDMLTPMSAYMSVRQSNSFLLESVEHGESLGKVSIIGCEPLMTVIGDSAGITISLKDRTSRVNGNPLDALATVHDSIDCDYCSESPIQNGLYGYFSWSVIQAIEPIVLKQSTNIPMFHFQVPEKLVIFDHAKQFIYVVATSLVPDAFVSLDDWVASLSSSTKDMNQRRLSTIPPLNWNDVTPNITKEDYMDGVKRVKHHIKEGDIFQGVLSQRFDVKKKKSPLEVYRSLRHINPSPYMVYFDYGHTQLIGSSPEILVQLTDGVARVRPIAGTRKRHGSVVEQSVIDDLVSDEKERAEHIMLVDLGRNDLGRVCEFDSIDVSDVMSIERYSHVIHMVSNVTGKIKQSVSPIDVIKATFPAGTVSGAPKIRAIQLLTDIEPDPRGIYSGAIGYMGFHGSMDMCIAIRTIVGTDDLYSVQAGAGIVYDSIPELEYEETRSKAHGVLQACWCGDVA